MIFFHDPSIHPSSKAHKNILTFDIMVEVCLSNFEELFPSVQRAIKNASFIAIDNEFTGLVTAPVNKASLFDSASERYSKLKETASSFTICQIGLSIFTRRKDENVYSVQTFVFYVRPYSCGSIDRRFLCQASAFDFLCRYNFDFNKFAQEGIPFLNEVEKKQLEKEFQNGSVFIHHERCFGSSLKYEQDLQLSYWLQTAEEGDQLTLERYIGGHEYLQLHEIRKKYPFLWATSQNHEVIVEKVSAERRLRLEETVADEENRVLQFYTGFSRVFNVLKEHKKPIVGHNLLTDILLIYASFHKPLPSTYKEFKRSVNMIFPVVYDTKHIWLNLKKFYDIDGVTSMSSLFELFNLLKSPPENLATLFCPAIELVNCQMYDAEEFPHDAGFDSYATGYVFLKICHMLAMRSRISAPLIRPPSFKEHVSAVKPFENKLNIMWAKLHYIDLKGQDPTSHRPHWLHVEIKNKGISLSKAEVTHKLSKFGGIELKMISKRGALIATSNAECAKQILKAFRNHEELVVSRYSLLKHSTPLRAVLWLTSFVSGSASLFLVLQLVKSLR